VIVPDANLLLYSVDSTSPFHAPAAKWWTDCLSGSVPVGLCQPVLFAFLRVSTNRRVFREPLSLDTAGDLVNEWIAHPVTRLLLPGEDHVTDAQIAALARTHRGEIHTADHDFRRFSGVTCHYPLRLK